MVTSLPETAPLSGETSDEALMLRFRNSRDKQALTTLIHRYERPLFGYLLRYTGDANQADELFQNTFERVFERSDQFEPGRRFRPWLYSIATHGAVDAARRVHRRQAMPLDAPVEHGDADAHTLYELLSDDAPSPLSQLEAKERREWVRAAVAALPDELRAIVIMAYYQGMSLREVSDALAVPLGTVKSRLHKALWKLNVAWRHGRHDEAA